MSASFDYAGQRTPDVDSHLVFFLFHPTPQERTLLHQLLDEPGHPEELEKDNYYTPWPADRIGDGDEKDVLEITRLMATEGKPVATATAIFVDRQSLVDLKALIVEVDPEDSGDSNIIESHRFPLQECSAIVNCITLGIYGLDDAIRVPL